jgi:HEAT repeat protein
VLGRLGDHRATGALTGAAADPFETVREAASRALDRIQKKG